MIHYVNPDVAMAVFGAIVVLVLVLGDRYLRKIVIWESKGESTTEST